jgi:Ca2+-binding RTX toxin-like protein
VVRRRSLRMMLVVSSAVVLAIAFTASPAFAAVPTIASFAPTSGAVGTSVVITGTGFTGTTSVTFHGTTAVFTIDSDTQITATVPAGATTGTISVTNPEGTATTSTSFTVVTSVSGCTFDSATATATIVLPGGAATILMLAGVVGVDGVACTGATETATDAIVVTGSTGSDDVTLDLRGGQFAPGATDEGDGSSEIELTIDLGAGTDSLRVAGGSGHNFIVLGSGGLNLNGTEKSPDADVTVANTEHYTLTGGVDKDILWAAGSYGTKRTFTGPVTIDGRGESDIIGGGNGRDVLSGGRGNDDLRPFGGSDKVTGGAGYDLVFFQASNGIRADLGRGMARGQGRDRLVDIEDMWGDAGDDVLVGDGRVNYIAAFGGDDVVKGKGGNDHLFGGPGNDLLRGGGGNDSINGQQGTDTCSQDAGSGELMHCEG